MFRGRHSATVDEKGRLKIPAEFKEYLDQQYGPEFFVTSLDGEFAEVYPVGEWAKKEEKLRSVASMNPVKIKFLRRTGFWGQMASADAQGRILLPQHLREKAELQGQVAVIGCEEHLEVWNMARITEQNETRQFTAAELKELSDLGI